MSERPASVFDLPALTAGAWAGWTQIKGFDPFEDLAGPFYSRVEPDGRRVCALGVEARHTNGHGTVHGGCLMTLADLSLFAIAKNAVGDASAVTVSLQGDFVGAAEEGDVLVASGDVVRAGGSLIFVQGLIARRDVAILSFSGIVKRFRPRR